MSRSAQSSKGREAGETSQRAGSSTILRTQARNTAKEARRSRGEIACAECRRLKIRCDRQVPCSTCVSRGCAILCPNDVLPPGDNSRHVSNATDHLQNKIIKMGERMHALEDALAIAQAQESDSPHPLLAEPFKLDDDIVEEKGSQSPTDSGTNVDAIAGSLGALHIDKKKKTVQFFGPTGGTESLLLDEGPSSQLRDPVMQDDITSIELRALGLPPEIDAFFLSFPFSPAGIPRGTARQAIEAFLPPWERAAALCRVFLENMSWMFQIVSLQQLTKELIPAIYFSPGNADLYSAHDLALFLISLAIGALVDTNLEPYNAEAKRYYVLARAAAGLQPIMETISIQTVKFMHLLSIYNGMSGKESNLSNTYALLNLAGVMAHKIGLHIDPSSWGLDEKTSYERRAYFWNLLQGDLWQSLNTGRPPSLANSSNSCRMPTEDEELKFQQGEVTIGFGIWGMRHTKECMLPLARFVNATTPPSYQKVLELDKKFRTFALPVPDVFAQFSSPSVSMRAWVRSHYLEQILLVLHRAFFAQAIESHPDNPLESPYGHSFITAYQCACVTLRTTSHQFGLYPELMSRVWQIWTFSFTSAVIVGAVATRAPHLNIEPPPFNMFEETCTLFRNAAKTNSRAAKGLPVLLTMREKALQLQRELSQRQPSNNSPNIKVEADDDRIAIFGGKTRLVANSSSSTGRIPASPVPIPMARTSYTSYPNVVPEVVPAQNGWQQSQVEPMLGQYALEPPMNPMSADPGATHPQWSLFRDSEFIDPYQAQFANPASEAGAQEPVDFILDDTWHSFMQHYGALPQSPVQT